MGKVGRPPKVDSRKRKYQLRMTQEEYEKLEYLSIQKGKTMSDILREGIEMIYNLERFS